MNMRRIASLFAFAALGLLICTSSVSAQTTYIATAQGGFCYTDVNGQLGAEHCAFPITGGGSFSFDPTGAARIFVPYKLSEQAPSGSLSHTIKSAEFGVCPQYPGDGSCEYYIIDMSGGWTNADGSKDTVSGEYTVESIHAGRNSSNRPYSGGLTIIISASSTALYPCGSKRVDCFKGK